MGSMAVRWLDLKGRIMRVLDDTNRTRPTYSDGEYLDYINGGLTALASHTAQECEYKYVTPGVINSLKLPDNLIQLEAVFYMFNNRKVMMKPYHLHPGESLPSLLTFLAPQPVMWTSNSYGNLSYFEYPVGTINFTLPVIENLDIHCHYFGYYDLVSDDSDVLPVPRWAEEGLVWYMQMLAMAKPSVQAAMLAQYKTRIDSGTPDDNPIMKSIEHCRRMWERCLESNPRQVRTGWEAN